MNPVALVLLGIAAVAVLLAWLRRRGQRLTALDRLANSSLVGAGGGAGGAFDGVPDDPVGRWLFLAGRRRADAKFRFWWATIAYGLVGVAIGLVVVATGALDVVERDLKAIPGEVGWLFVPVVIALPMLLPVMLASLPTVAVRRRRRERVDQILRDLYPALELFASLAQAGLAFDAALARVLTTLGQQRPLGRELATFQAEVLGGADRSRSFRRLARRIELPQTTSFTSALIRGHEVGIGLAATLRRQADELRNDLRERALARAQSLPARLVFPLVICFLPGIFVMSLGPALFGFLVDTAGFGSTR